MRSQPFENSMPCGAPGEAIYDTTPWTIYGEGPTAMKTNAAGCGIEEESRYTEEDIRDTVKGDVLYAICLDRPGEKLVARSLKRLYPQSIEKIEMLGVDGELTWSFDRHEGVSIETSGTRPCEHAFVFRITCRFGWRRWCKRLPRAQRLRWAGGPLFTIWRGSGIRITAYPALRNHRKTSGCAVRFCDRNPLDWTHTQSATPPVRER